MEKGIPGIEKGNSCFSGGRDRSLVFQIEGGNTVFPEGAASSLFSQGKRKFLVSLKEEAGFWFS